MPLQGSGICRLRLQSRLDDWRQFGTGWVGLQAVERSPSLPSRFPDGRPQASSGSSSTTGGPCRKVERFFFFFRFGKSPTPDALHAAPRPHPGTGPQVDVTGPSPPDPLPTTGTCAGLISFKGSRRQSPWRRFYGAGFDGPRRFSRPPAGFDLRFSAPDRSALAHARC